MSNFPSASVRWAFNVREWIPTRDQWRLAMQCVQKEEKERCYKFVFAEDCKSSVVGRLLMRKAASEALDIQYDKVVFARTESGKPYLIKKNGEDFYFNISHNGDYCVLASELNFNIGIDVMKMEYKGRSITLLEYFNLMRKQFSTYEWDFIMLPGLEREQLQRFYRLWCLKESYVKATGTGIAFDLKTLSFSCTTPFLKQNVITADTKVYLKDKFYSEWKFEETLLDANHCVAVALELTQMNVQHVNQPMNFTFLTFEELVRHSKPFETVTESFWEDFKSKQKKY
ncbi:L-aminoadipate-semialdehyde dehydrogenase-phosphopantetheinyl transferase-like [Stegodyphus dumicola]|uniref:L-aminoadipate-semialdehyde dehydrogenase-phosphopantetheinyl transferase-like n=1 Tax=Stegodyphus dumicola TaxID=202533 RepID=UPI0015B11158|nr:L-aminoadipate-semialdehyde dehydrogenase-phosphopantetheinyl transferase-like [Stegodyphus dumicola]